MFGRLQFQSLQTASEGGGSITRKGTNAFKTDEVVIKPLPDELQFLHDFFKSIFCHNKSEE